MFIESQLLKIYSMALYIERLIKYNSYPVVVIEP